MKITLNEFRELAARVRVVPEYPEDRRTQLCSLSPDALDGLLNLIDQAGDWLTREGTLAGGGDHDRGGTCHVVYPEPGTWDIEQDTPGCDYGLYQPPENGDPADYENWVQVKECTCGFNDLLRALGKEVE